MEATLQESIQSLDMEKFVYYLAHKNSSDVIGMEFDDVVSELNEELIKGLAYYSPKNLPMEQMRALMRRMLDNRISELKYKYFVTYRKNYLNATSIETDILSTKLRARNDPVSIIESNDRVFSVRSKLSGDAVTVFDYVILGDGLVDMKFTDCTKKLHYAQLAIVLGMSDRIVKMALVEIKETYSEVLDEN